MTKKKKNHIMTDLEIETHTYDLNVPKSNLIQ